MTIWDEYIAHHPEFTGVDPPVEQFGDSPSMADELLQLVISGVKRATAGQAPTDVNNIPQVGDHWVVADSHGVPRLVVRTTHVRVGPLNSVDDQFAYDEGEGDRTRTWWLDAHRRFYRRTGGPDLATATNEDLDDLATVFERFAVVWPRELAS